MADLRIDRGLYVTIENDSTRELCSSFLRWQMDNRVFPLRGTSGGGLGTFYGMFRREDVPKLIEFFAEHDWDIRDSAG